MTTLHGCVLDRDKRIGGYRVRTPDREHTLGTITPQWDSPMGGAPKKRWAAKDYAANPVTGFFLTFRTREMAAEAIVERALRDEWWRPDFGPETDTDTDAYMRELGEVGR